jgi:ABC-type phosphate/phosphonate transport system substrate-binding protein
MRRRPGRGLLSVAWLMAVAALAAQPAVDVSRVGLSRGVIEGVSPSDARAAAMVWAEGVSGAMGVYQNAEATIFTSLDDAVRAVGEGRTQLAVLTSVEYLEVEGRIGCDPVLVYEVQGQVMHEYVLLARTREPRRPPAGAAVTVFSPSREQALPTLWAGSYFQSQGAREGLTVFSQVRTVDKRGRATTAVFFGQSDYGIDTSSAYASAVELNPQIGRDVTVLARSPRLLPGLVCAARSLTANQRQRFIEHATRLHEQTRYQQSLMLMRLTRLVAWHPSMLDTARALVASQSAVPRRGGGP